MRPLRCNAKTSGEHFGQGSPHYTMGGMGNEKTEEISQFHVPTFKNVTLTNLCTALRLAEINEEETPEYVYWLYRIIDAEELPDEEEK